ncbi:hypothetical protein BDZ97DRAFT_1900252 [Flammula alnicola]|nr:hypothetical protein BDZ97DRAFT_1900252 [Flammula alnicola]
MNPCNDPSGIAIDKPATQTVLVIGMGMTALAFIEKLFEQDAEETGGKGWTVTVVGEEPYVAYNRVGLALYLQTLPWYKSHPPNQLNYITNDACFNLTPAGNGPAQEMLGFELNFDICVFATGSQAAIPPYVKPADIHTTRGIFAYRTVEDLNGMINYTQERPVKKVAVIGGGLLGLEAAKALSDLDPVSQVTIIERNKWVLSRQLDQEGGRIVLDQVKAMGIEVLLESRVQTIVTSKKAALILQWLTLRRWIRTLFDMVVFSVGIRPRDDLAKTSGIDTHLQGGIVIRDDLTTSLPNIYAIGECAAWEGKTYGFIAPGIEMANVLAFNLTKGPSHKMRKITTPDMSTKLKLVGVNVACFGDYFADSKLPGTVNIPGHSKHRKISATDHSQVRSLLYHDPFGPAYKKYIFSGDGKYLLGGIMVGDVDDYTKLLSLVKDQKSLDIPPDGEFEGDDLDDNTQICSCYNVSKGAISKAVAAGCKSFGEVKAKTKAGTGCGGCVPLATSIFNSEMKKLGHAVANHIYVMKEAGHNPNSIGCEVCKPAVASILSSLHNEFVMAPVHHQNQDTNDKYLANIQRNGTYSVIPRIPAGEITPAKLNALAVVAQKYSLYTKITGGQRIDLFGASKQDLPDIWEELGFAGFESGHAYGKALRTVKSCVGTSWCRFGVGDSVGLAVELEERYKGIRAPHKFKGGVSGCVRECAEAQGKDFGVIATSKGWNVYVGGNGGAKPRHAELLAADVSQKKAIKIIDRFLMLYIQSADRLQRTARWVESLGEGGKNGLEYLKRVIIDDSLGICEDLDQSMDALVGTYFDEWAEVVRNPEKRALFRQFANTDEIKRGSEIIEERGQKRPADWPEDSTPLKFDTNDIAEDHDEWQWRKVAKLQDLHPTTEGSTSIVINYSDTQLAIFRLPNGALYATQQLCPHRRAFVLSDGLLGDTVDGKPYVSCPLHNPQKLDTNHKQKELHPPEGNCLSDDNYKIMTFEVKEEYGDLFIKLPEPPR